MISAARIHIRGRLNGLSSRHAARLAEWRGATVVGRLSAADRCVVAHSCASTWGPASLAALPVPAMSELAFRRAVGLLPPLPPEARPYGLGDIAAHSGLCEATIRDLCVFDVLDGPDAFGFRDIAVARDAGRLLDGGTPLPMILAAGAELRARGIRLNAAALHETPWGDLASCEGELLVSVDGQMELPLGEPRLRFEEVFDIAAECETEGDLDEAERLYRLAAKLNPREGTSVFNLGNVLVSLGRSDEAITAFLTAAARERELSADAHYNIAILQTRRGQDERAEASYLAALRSQPSHPDARHNLALLYTAQGRRSEAVQIWDALAGEGDLAARRQATLCRMEMMALRSTGA